ncbi:hypothetical protein C1N91_02830 [Curtobacterium sp. SGAir0471]|uniref:S24/S26 family peptidase n=1 Tax=Curtobacterium sp. SGAir0471 TaxID=2070337 RepID=UPI0010CD271D|nr:S24/S26 family peptidase [Curtobacterium sp. SGAir0471]QCR42642.1 hypothetical protein C1N91_02830 [Curtobacterium sp. SGAir0471]
MVSIAVHGGHTPHDVLHDAVDWGRVVVATAARAVVATLLGLALWAAAPALIGWHPTTVMTGSMAPRLVPGDVVVSRPVTPAEIRPGQVLLADDPDQPGHLRMHRFVEPGPDGTVVTKGDANPQADSTPTERSAVHGVAVLRVPSVATPVLWVREGRWVEVGTAALALVAVLLLCTVDAPLRRRGARHRGNGPAAGGGGGASGRGRTGGGREARLATAPSPAVSTATGPRRWSPRPVARHAHVHGRSAAGAAVQRVRQVWRGGTPGALAVVITVVAGAGVVLPAARAEAAPFGRTTSTAAQFAAATVPVVTGLSCADSNGSVVIGWTYAGDPPRSFTLTDNTGAVLATTADGQARSATVALSGALVLGAQRTVRVQTNAAAPGAWTSVQSSPVAIQYTSILGLGSGTTCVR